MRPLNGKGYRATPTAKTAIYARYSSHNQDDGTSIEVQLDVCRRAADGEPIVEYIDRAVTGTTMQREAFCRLLDDCEAGRVSTVYVYKWDRFGRSARAHTVIADLEEWGVKVISATEGQEPLSRGIQLVVAEDYSRKLAERVRSAKLMRFHQGGYHGGSPPFGYRVIRDGKLNRLEPDWGGQAETVAWIFKTYSRDNVGTKEMARMLNEKGIKARRADYWGASSVRMLLVNTLYVGRPVRLGKVSSRDRHQGVICHNNPTRLERVDESLRIIDDETFEHVQRKQRARKVLRPVGQNRTRRFSKMIRCGCCGSVFVRTGHADRPIHYWTCGLRQRQDSGKCPNSVYLNEEALAESIQRGMVAAFDDEKAIIDEAVERATELSRSHEHRVEDVNKQIAACDAELNRLAVRLMDGDLSDPAVKRLLSGKVAEKTSERDRLVGVREQIAGEQNSRKAITAAVRETFALAKQALSKVTSDSEFNQFVHDFVGPIVVYPGGKIEPGKSIVLSAGAQSDWAAYYRQQRVLASIHVPHATNIVITDESPAPLVERWRAWTRDALAEGFTEEQSLDHALLCALVLGDSDPELRDVQEQFRRTGTSHHLAISGMHIAVMGGVVFMIARLLRLSPRVAWWAAMIFVSLYGIAALPSAPVVRSVLLWLAIGVAILSRRATDLLQLLALVVIAMLLYHPLDLFNAGFQLSFGIVLGLIVLTKPMSHLFGMHKRDESESVPTRWILRAAAYIDSRIILVLAAGVVAWLVSMPVIASHFTQLNPWAIFASIAIAPVVFVALIAGVMKIVFTAAFPSLAWLWADVAQVPTMGMRLSVEWLGKLPYGDVPLPPPAWWMIGLFYTTLLLAAIGWSKPSARILCRLAHAAAIFVLLWMPYRSTITQAATGQSLRVTLLSVGAGQCAVIEPPSGRVVLIDAGSLSLADPVRRAIAPYLRARGITQIDTITVSHANSDHFSAVGELVEAYGVREIMVAPNFYGSATDNPMLAETIAQLNRNQRPPTTVAPGHVMPLGTETSIKVLWPPASARDLRSNDQSLVLMLTHAGTRILFTGDIEDDAMRELIKDPDAIRADVLIAPHHGSHESATATFLQAVSAKQTIASNDRTLTGKQLRFDTLVAGTPFYRTHTSGAVTVVIAADGSYVITPHLADPREPAAE